MKIPRPATHSLPMRAAKVGADLALWGRVGARRTVEHALVPAAVRPLPEGIPGTAVLHSTAEVDAAVEQARRLRLPLHPTRAKNWDVLGAVRAVLEHAGPDARVLDAGAARYSTVLPSLRLYGLTGSAGSTWSSTAAPVAASWSSAPATSPRPGCRPPRWTRSPA